MVKRNGIALEMTVFERPSGARRRLPLSQGFVRRRGLHPGLFSLLPPGAIASDGTSKYREIAGQRAGWSA